MKINTKGKLFVVEASDGCGKATQTKILSNRLKSEGYNVHLVSFPNYNSHSSALIKMYQNGDFGNIADAINPYAASVFYAVDRYASYKTKWQEWYKKGDIIIADRYTTSNMIYQAIKIKDTNERALFKDWLQDLEFCKFELPKPDLVLFLEMPPLFSNKLIKNRALLKIENLDIHERNNEYLTKCYEEYVNLAQKNNWQTIYCIKEDNNLKSVQQIHNEIYDIIIKFI